MAAGFGEGGKGKAMVAAGEGLRGGGSGRGGWQRGEESGSEMDGGWLGGEDEEETRWTGGGAIGKDGWDGRLG